MTISKKIKYGIIVLFCILSEISFTQVNNNKEYAVALDYTPVLNSSDFNSVFGGISGKDVKLGKNGLISEMEFIAFPNTVFEIEEIIPENNYNIYKVTTNDYQYNSSALFIDSRFVKLLNQKPEDRIKTFPSENEILNNLKSLVGYPYMWGGNYAEGIDKMLEYYPPKESISNSVKDLWKLKGVDCSGLLYQATGGCTLRNTSSLITSGKAIEIKGKTAKEISEMLLPLDLIAWNGHVIIVLDNDNVIESTPSNGVHITDLLERLNSIMKERKPVNDWNSAKGKRFVVRRIIN